MECSPDQGKLIGTAPCSWSIQLESLRPRVPSDEVSSLSAAAAATTVLSSDGGAGSKLREEGSTEEKDKLINFTRIFFFFLFQSSSPKPFFLLVSGVDASDPISPVNVVSSTTSAIRRSNLGLRETDESLATGAGGAA